MVENSGAEARSCPPSCSRTAKQFPSDIKLLGNSGQCELGGFLVLD